MIEKNQEKSFVEREIAKKRHLIHKLKAKDSTGRWAYYFVLVEPPRSQETIELEYYEV